MITSTIQLSQQKKLYKNYLSDNNFCSSFAISGAQEIEKCQKNRLIILNIENKLHKFHECPGGLHHKKKYFVVFNTQK